LSIDVSKFPRPLHDRVLVRRIPEDESKKLIIAPEIARAKPLKAEVLAVGPGRYVDDQFFPTQVQAGSMVLLSPSVNREWPDIIEGSGITMIQEADILGVLES
jgi:chaperonin GroES